MKKIFDRYDKALLQDLPRANFPGHIEVIVSEREAQKAVDFLMKQPLLVSTQRQSPRSRWAG